jgi:hypothetical protein
MSRKADNHWAQLQVKSVSTGSVKEWTEDNYNRQGNCRFGSHRPDARKKSKEFPIQGGSKRVAVVVI